MAIYCVRANFGKYAKAFVDGEYVAIGWLENVNLSAIHSEDYDKLTDIFKEDNPKASKMSAAQNIGQIWRFLIDIKEHDVVVTPAENVEDLFYGEIISGYYYGKDEICPYPHRKKVKWEKKPLLRSSLSIPLQNSLRSSLTVFYVKHESTFLEAIGKRKRDTTEGRIRYSEFTHSVLNRILELSAEEFEMLVTELLSAIGFEADHVGKVGDGGVDAHGVLDIYGMAKVDLCVQAKRYQIHGSVGSSVVKDLRASVPEKSQGCIITTSIDIPKKTREECTKLDFKRIGLIDGNQLVEILIEHYQDLSEELRNKLRLRLVLFPE
jgi:restriction system protein